MKCSLAALAVGLIAWTTAAAAGAQADLHAPLDRLLDTYVRDGMVYYRAIKSDRGGLDRYIGSLNVPRDRVESWPRGEQIAFWVNAYNALVLRTVVNAYPVSGSSPDYPAGSIRQIPGAFEGVRHPVGGRLLALDEIETEVLAAFGDARVILLLGRGALGSPRLRSEAIRESRLETQLSEAVRECARRTTCVEIDEPRGAVVVTPIVGWRQELFIETFRPEDGAAWAQRSPIEQAVITMVYPHLFDGEQQFLQKNTFRMSFGEIDWRLNDLTGRDLPRPGTEMPETVENRPVPHGSAAR